MYLLPHNHLLATFSLDHKIYSAADQYMKREDEQFTVKLYILWHCTQCRKPCLTIYSYINCQNNCYDRKIMISSSKSVLEIIYYVVQFFKQEKEHKLDINVAAVTFQTG